ncbi:MAG TPA: YqaA family protein [Burkholderiaceae bacterium]
METWFTAVLHALALPQYGLATLFVVALLSATLLPLGSEPLLIGLLHVNPALFWPAVITASVGNTLGGAITYATGFYARRAWTRLARKASPAVAHPRAHAWLARWGAPACVLAWLPVVGDPLCAVAGWLELPLLRCVGWMALGKFLRYLAISAIALRLAPAWFGG